MENIDIPQLINIYAIPWGIRIVTALVIFIIGRMVVAVVVGIAQKLMLRQKLDETLVIFVVAILRALLLLFVIIAALSQLGIDTTSLIALIGAAGLAIGLSLQSSLSNFAAGVMLIIFRPFVKGNFVEAGNAMGTIDKVNIFTTTMITPDNKEIIVPNGTIMSNNITNFSAKPTRRVDMTFGISYDDDLRLARSILQDIVEGDERVLADPAPAVVVGALADSSVNFLVRPWVNSADYWPVFWDTTEKVKLRFDEAGITIPFPQRELHITRYETAMATEQARTAVAE
ncbi:mechanosensitive ion channel family protein [Chromatocurvus halotolerans]|uniref:Small-conductance mechanosensitive channel n=1 Tax=Chromatocurvus halotolerans TaxID=1132028 RepID=A0A4R2KQQ0_9GAMM|nr:mechanosensitive ion channel domain-containing protein [Chromatocurvus halotolerans]TCO75944.1 small conductance mechanosensitive channel [Chromatocurvus halotolerans]